MKALSPDEKLLAALSDAEPCDGRPCAGSPAWRAEMLTDADSAGFGAMVRHAVLHTHSSHTVALAGSCFPNDQDGELFFSKPLVACLRFVFF